MTDPKNQANYSQRRNFLHGAGLAAAGIGVLAVGAAPALAAPARPKAVNAAAGDLDILQTALALEHEGIGAYSIAGGSGLLTPDVLKVALVFLGHHKAHRDSLAALIQKAGGRPVEPKSDAEYTAALNLGALKSQGDVLTLAAGLEKGAASAYLGQLTALRNHSLSRLFAQLSSDEAVHWAVLNNALGNAVPSAAYLIS
jgi:rubrerythrin